MMDLSFLDPIQELLKDPTVQEQIDHTARIFFSNGGLTINLIPALIALTLGALLLLPLLGIPILDLLADGMGAMASGYGATVSSGYGGGHGFFSRGDNSAYYDQTIADLQQQVTALQESEASLRSAVYYNAPVDSGAQVANSIGYSS